MDFLLDALAEIATGIFNRTANLLNLSCDVVFVDTSSTYWELDVADEEIELAEARAVEGTRGGEREPAVGSEAAWRQFSKNSKDHRTDLPQVVIAMAVTAEGVPIRCWTFPGTMSDQLVIRRVKDDLGSWMLNRVIWVTDSGFNSGTNRAYLQRGGDHYIVCEKLRSASADAKAALSRAGRYHVVAGNLSVKEVRVGDGARGSALVRLRQPRGQSARRDRAQQPRRLPRPAHRGIRCLGALTARRALRRAAPDPGALALLATDQGSPPPHRPQGDRP